MDTDTRERTSVVMLRGHGEERLRTAIMQSLIREELIQDVEEVLREIDSIRCENQLLKTNLKNRNAELDKYRGMFVEAIQFQKKAEARKAKLGTASCCAIAAGTLFVIILACMMICRAIFG